MNSAEWLKQTFKFGVSALLIAYCLTIVDIESVYAEIKNVKVSYLLIAAIFTLLGTVICKSYFVWLLLPNRELVKPGKVIFINLAMRFYTMILPKGFVAVIRWNKYRKISDPKYALVLIAFEAIIALTVASLVSMVFIFLESGIAQVPIWMKGLTVILSFFWVLLVYIFFIRPDGRAYENIETIFAKIIPWGFIAKGFEKWKATAIKLNIADVKIYRPAFVISTIGHIMFLIGAYYLFRAMDVSVSFIAIAWVRSIVFIMVSMPISMAGIGIREVGLISLFGLYHINADVVMAYSLLVLAIQLGIGIIGMFVEVENLFSERLSESN